jgi:uncharacterized protein YkwD
MSDEDQQITTISPQRHRAAVTQLVDEQRREHGLSALVPSRQLALSARAWAVVRSATTAT